MTKLRNYIDLFQVEDGTSPHGKAKALQKWQERLLRCARNCLDTISTDRLWGEVKFNPFLFLRLTQTLRNDGKISPDFALAMFYYAFTGIRKRDNTRIPEYHDSKRKFKELSAGLDRQNNEGRQKMGRAWMRCRFASTMRHAGEEEIASLILNEPEIINERLIKGFNQFFKEGQDQSVTIEDDFLEIITLYIPDRAGA